MKPLPRIINQIVTEWNEVVYFQKNNKNYLTIFPLLLSQRIEKSEHVGNGHSFHWNQ